MLRRVITHSKWASPSRRSTLSLGDQAVSSASNTLAVLAAAQVSSVPEFGAIALQLSILLVALSLCRGALGTPLLLASAESPESLRTQASFSLVAAITCGLAAGVAMVGCGWASGQLEIAVILALTCPLVLAQDVLRFWAMAAGLPGRALLWDGVWAAGSMFALIASWARWPFMHSTTVLAAWGAAAALSVAGLAITSAVTPMTSSIGAWIRRNTAQRMAFGLESSLGALTTVLVFAICSYRLGNEATAALRGAGTILGPLSVVMSALPLFAVPESVREGRGISSVWIRMRRPGFTLSLISLGIGGAAFFLPNEAGRFILGATWTVARPLFLITAAEYALVVWLSCLFTALKAAGLGGALLRLRVVYLIVTLCLVLAATTVRDARAPAVALIGSVLVVLAVGLHGLRIAQRAPQARAITYI